MKRPNNKGQYLPNELMHWTYNQSKYKNQWTEYNGVNYQSKKEAAYAKELDLLQKAKQIKSWKRQIKMPIEINGQHICNYICDFEILNNDGTVTYADAKGMKSGVPYQMFKLKTKLVKALYNIDIKEV